MNAKIALLLMSLKSFRCNSRMEKIGPPLEVLIRRLSETPEQFYVETKTDSSSFLKAIVLVVDLLNKFGISANNKIIQDFRPYFKDKNHRILAMACVWLLYDDSLSKISFTEAQIKNLLIEALDELSKLGKTEKFISNQERREELVRIVLSRLNYRPKGESIAQAKDRLSSLSIVERKHLFEEIKIAEKRAKEIREAIAKKAAEDSADKSSRE